jgi:multidrug resistance efflux pump
MYQSGNARCLRYCASALLIVGSAALSRGALGAPGGATDRAKATIAELEADPVERELIAPVIASAKQSLARAESEQTPDRAAILGDTALEWAEVARDLKRASQAEQASDRLEQEASAQETELARLRAAVEQAMARVGHARRALAELEGGAPSAGPPGARAPVPSTAPAPAPGPR